METSYEKAYKILKHINENMIHKVEEAYTSNLKEIEKRIMNHECLNRSRAITVAAVKCLNSGYETQPYSNKNIVNNLYELKTQDYLMNKKSAELGFAIDEFKKLYIDKRLKISQENSSLIQELNNGKTAGEELYNSAKKLGEYIQKLINEEFYQEYTKIINQLDAVKRHFCAHIEDQYSQINALENKLIGTIYSTVWSSIEFSSYKVKQ